MTEIKLSPDGSTITVFVPMAWRRRGGRKVIVAPPGCDDWAPPPKIDRALVKALARAHRWQRLLESGEYGTLAELADAERISRSYVCRVLRLTLLAPDIVERVLDGRPAPQLARLIQPFPVAWAKQRELFSLADAPGVEPCMGPILPAEPPPPPGAAPRAPSGQSGLDDLGVSTDPC
jgi:hypothetical protein